MVANNADSSFKAFNTLLLNQDILHLYLPRFEIVVW